MHGVSRMVLASHMIMSAVRPYAQTDPVAPNSRALWRHKVGPLGVTPMCREDPPPGPGGRRLPDRCPMLGMSCPAWPWLWR